MCVIRAANVTKSFKNITVVDNVSLTLQEGTICGLIGRNGSGKTVLMKLIIGFLTPDNGEIEVLGKKIGKDVDFAPNTGAIIETPGFLPHETGFVNLKYLASIRHKISDDDIKASMERVGLNADDKKRVGKYSLGMRQRLGLAQAIMENPDILILDEPMNGLDKSGVSDMRKYLQNLKAQGKTILIASHSSEDIDVLCDHVYEMDKGLLSIVR